MGEYPNPLKPAAKASARRRCVMVLAAAVTVTSLSALGGCGSEKDNDRKSAGNPSASPTPDPNLKKKDGDATGKSRKPYAFDPQNPVDETKLVCSTPLGLEIELNPSTPAGSQIFLTGRLDPLCFENRILVIRLRADKGFRLSAGMTCQKVTTGDFNYECSAAPAPFIQADSIAVPVSVIPGSQTNFKAEAEMMLQEAPK
jgi:hypothetical protein